MRLEHSLPRESQTPHTRPPELPAPDSRPVVPTGRAKMPDIDFSLLDEKLPEDTPRLVELEIPQPQPEPSPQSEPAPVTAAPLMVPQQSADEILESLFGSAPAAEAQSSKASSSVSPSQIQKQVKAQMEAQQQALMQAQARANLRAQAQAARAQQTAKPAEPVAPTGKDIEKPAAPGSEESLQEPTGKKDRKRPGRKSKAQEEKERAAREKELEEARTEPQDSAQAAEPAAPVESEGQENTRVPEPSMPRPSAPMPSVLPPERPEIKSAKDVASFLSEPIAEPKPEPPQPEPPAELSTYEQLQMGQHRFVNPIETTVKPKFTEFEPPARAPEVTKQQPFPDIDWTTPADELGSSQRGQAPWDTNSGAVISQVPDQLWQQLSSAQEPEPKEPDVVFQRDFRDPVVPPEWNTTGQRPQPNYSEAELKEFLKQPAQPGHLSAPTQRGYPSDETGYPSNPPGYPAAPTGYPTSPQQVPAASYQDEPQLTPQPQVVPPHSEPVPQLQQNQSPQTYAQPEQPAYPAQQPAYPVQPEYPDQPAYPAPNIVAPAAKAPPSYEVYKPQLQQGSVYPGDPYAGQYANANDAGLQYIDQGQEQYSQAPAIESFPCRECSAPMELGARFCGECGYKVEIKIRSCHLCGAPLDETAKFCGECGSKLAESAELTLTPVQQMQHKDPRAMHQQHYAPSEEKPSQRGWVNKLIKFLDE